MKVAILGAGFMGTTHAACYQQIEDVEVAAVVDLREEQRARLAGETGAVGYERMEAALADETIDIVDCCYPTFLHRDAVVAAFEAGKHVLCEKPFALSVEECDDMIAAARRAGKKFMIAQVIRFWPEYAAVKELVAAGAVGEVQAVVAHRLASPPDWGWQNWFLDGKKSLGAAVDLQIHDLDFIRYLIGDPLSVATNGLQSAAGAWDYVFTTLKYADRLAFTEASFLMPPNWPFRAELRVVGTEGTLELDLSQDPSLRLLDAAGETTVPQTPEKDGYLAEIEYFCNAVREDAPIVVAAPEDSRESLRLALCTLESAATGRPAPFAQG